MYRTCQYTVSHHHDVKIFKTAFSYSCTLHTGEAVPGTTKRFKSSDGNPRCVCFPPSDLPTGSYIQEDLSRCSSLCEAGRDCCDLMASCKCGTHTGQYDCICEKGYYGKGLQHECTGKDSLAPVISAVSANSRANSFSILKVLLLGEFIFYWRRAVM